MKMKHIKLLVTSLLLSLTLLFGGCSPDSSSETPSQTSDQEVSYNLESIPKYTSEPYVMINENVPFFTESDFTEEAFETYSDLDELGRCGAAFANVGKETMPTEERGQIGMIKPSGWQTVKYDCVDGKYLYNRCHLIGYQLSSENANEKNIGTLSCADDGTGCVRRMLGRSFFFSAGRRLRQRLCFHRRLCHRQAAFGQGRVLVHVQRGRARGNGHPKGR